MKHNPEFLKLCVKMKAEVSECTIDDVHDWLSQQQDFLLIDVREDHEWTNGHLPGATHLGKGIIERDIETICPSQKATIVLYCGGGFRSALAAKSLNQMGYENVISMEGGFSGWKEKGLPIEN